MKVYLIGEKPKASASMDLEGGRERESWVQAVVNVQHCLSKDGESIPHNCHCGVKQDQHVWLIGTPASLRTPIWELPHHLLAIDSLLIDQKASGDKKV